MKSSAEEQSLDTRVDVVHISDEIIVLVIGGGGADRTAQVPLAVGQLAVAAPDLVPQTEPRAFLADHDQALALQLGGVVDDRAVTLTA
jgi:hypothetical protein